MYFLALNTFREIARSRAFIFIGILTLLMFFGIVILNTLALWESAIIIPDFGFFFMELSGVFTILTLWNRMITREYEERTIYLTLSRPISRMVIFFWKYIGFVWILWILFMWQIAVLISLTIIFDVAWNILWIWSLFGIILKLLILLAVMLTSSVILSHILAVLTTIMVYIVWHSGYSLLEHGITQSNVFMEYTAQSILLFFPNLNNLNVKAMIYLPITPDYALLGNNYLIACLYGIILLIIGAWCFSYRSFEQI